MTRSRLEFNLSGLGVRFEALPPDIEPFLRDVWGAYAMTPEDRQPLLVSVEEEGRALPPGRTMSEVLDAEPLPGGAVRFVTGEGRVEIDAGGASAAVHLASGDAGRRGWGLVNLTLAAIGRRLLAREGAALHAAGIIVDGRAFVLVGPSRSGKTTWAAAASRAGIPVLSDDVVLLDSTRGRLEALGAPFRDRDYPPPGRGRWPVAAILLPRHGPAAAIAPATVLVAAGRIAGNLLYSAGAWEGAGGAGNALDAIVRGAPALELTFAPDASFVPLLRSLP